MTGALKIKVTIGGERDNGRVEWSNANTLEDGIV